MNDTSDLVPTKQAAKIIGLSFATLQKWRFQNNKVKIGKKPHPDLKHVRVGGKVMYFKSKLLKFMERNTFGED